MSYLVSGGQGWKGKIDDCYLRFGLRASDEIEPRTKPFWVYLRHGNIPFGLFRLAAGLKTAHRCWRHRRELGGSY